MVWEQKSYIIVMLTNEVEGHKLKCHPYWGRQRDEPVQYGNMEVTLIDESDSSAWKIRCFNLHNKKVFRSSENVQIHFASSYILDDLRHRGILRLTESQIGFVWVSVKSNFMLDLFQFHVTGLFQYPKQTFFMTFFQIMCPKNCTHDPNAVHMM